jgi:meso-butanediol dehydrogenase/(S,S)-butanediol dehydrogenase/diacetyl reductase
MGSGSIRCPGRRPLREGRHREGVYVSRLAGKCVLVTGAAHGIGSAIASRCASEGASVVLADIDGDAAIDTAGEIASQGGVAVGVAADAAQDDDMDRAIAVALGLRGQLDVVFANAGVPAMAHLEDITLEMFQRVMRVNVYSVIVAARTVAKVMKQQPGGGKLILTCSISGKMSGPEQTLYSASKYAVRSLTQGIAKEYGPRITVNALCPGMVDTRLWDEATKILRDRGRLREDASAVNMFDKYILLGRPAKPFEVTGLAVFLASEDSDYMTGQCINIDGGIMFD